jgi:hypothetical protein
MKAGAIDEDSLHCSIEVHIAQQGTTVTGDGRNRTMQPRHRARDGSLLGFSRELNPAEFEWMVDKINIRVNGSWQSRAAEAFFREQLGIPSVDWFTSPTLESGNLVISTVARENSTIGNLRLSFRNLNKPVGQLQLSVDCNPTRTLAHIVAEAPTSANLSEHLLNMDVLDFFAPARPSNIVRSLDNETNWLPSPQDVRRRLGGSIGDIFLPIFFDKLKTLVARLLGITSLDDGTDQVVIYGAGATARLVWGQVMVPQIESYFERHHSGARTAVRTASMKILSADHTTNVTRYSGNHQFEREQDCFKLLIPIMANRKLVVYAKTRTRIRFEVRRDKSGRYGVLPPSVYPTDRVLNIIAHERHEAARVCNWSDIGSLFDEADMPSFVQLTEFLATVAGICAPTNATVEKVIRLLLIDGSISEGAQSEIPAGTITALETAGIVARTRVRTRDLRNTNPRLALAAQHHDLRERLMEFFYSPAPSDEDETSGT